MIKKHVQSKKQTASKKRKYNASTWKVSTLDIQTGKTTVRFVRKTYDEITMLVNRTRNKNNYTTVCAEEVDGRSKKLLRNGRVVALDSVEDERLMRRDINDLTVELDSEFTKESYPDF